MHAFEDLEKIYSERSISCLKKIYQINQELLPASKHIKKNVADNKNAIKVSMEYIRTYVKNETKSFIDLVHRMTSNKLDKLQEIEDSLLENLQNQEKTYHEYISYLENLFQDFQAHRACTRVQNNPIIFSPREYFNIQPIPVTYKITPPEFTAGQYNEDDVEKLLGKINIPCTEPEIRKPEDRVSREWRPTEIQRIQDNEISDVTQPLSLPYFMTQLRNFKVSGVLNVFHMSIDVSGKRWVSDNIGNLVEIDLQGNQLQSFQASVGSEGYHTMSQNGDLMYTDGDNKMIKKINLHTNEIVEYIKTGDWKPLSIHCSHLNGDILVGMNKDEEAQVTRYNKRGKEIQNIYRDNKGQKLYDYPYYIAENINGDICASDYNKNTVVVVNKSGETKFSYTGQMAVFYPCGICTDGVGHILVCDSINRTIHLLNKEGQFLSLLLSPQQSDKSPHSVCFDDENNLYVGENKNNTITVYKIQQDV